MATHTEHEDLPEHREITIETLRTPPIQVRPASRGRRICAGMIDSVILITVWMLLRFAFGGDLAAIRLELPSLVVGMYLGILVFFYYFVLEGLFAATIGKLVVKIRVLGIDGEPCSFAASFKRNILRFIDWLPALYVLGGLVVLASSRRQRLGDLVAETIVSPTPEKDINPPPAPFLFH